MQHSDLGRELPLTWRGEQQCGSADTKVRESDTYHRLLSHTHHRLYPCDVERVTLSGFQPWIARSVPNKLQSCDLMNPVRQLYSDESYRVLTSHQTRDTDVSAIRLPSHAIRPEDFGH